MSKGKRIAICLVVALVTVPAMVFVMYAVRGETSNAIVGAVGAIAVFAAWFLTAPK
jgi:uncharacterized BrkB/YihY/UPF0761 family membrane protein